MIFLKLNIAREVWTRFIHTIYTFLFLFSFFYFLISFSNAQPSATLDQNKILIGQQFHLDLRIHVPAQHTVIFPETGDTLIAQIEVVDKTKIDTIYDQDDITQKTLHQQLILTSFDSGFFAIPPFRFIVNNDTQETEPLLVEVQMVQADSTQLADIKNPLDVDYSFFDRIKDHWQWIVGVILGLAVLAYGIYYFTKKKPLPQIIIEKPKPVLPAHVIALQKLEKLKEKKLWQNDKVKQYHIELSEIIREYLENRFRIAALEQTTYEIIQSLKTSSIENISMEKLKQLLSLSDLVKFAKEIPLATENEMVWSKAYDFVENTKLIREENDNRVHENPIEVIRPVNHQ